MICAALDELQNALQYPKKLEPFHCVNICTFGQTFHQPQLEVKDQVVAESTTSSHKRMLFEHHAPSYMGPVTIAKTTA